MYLSLPMKKLFIFFASFFLWSSFSHAIQQPASPFQVEKELSVAVKPGEDFEVPLRVTVPEEHYLYAEKLDVLFESLEGIRIERIEYPKPTKKFDEFLGKEVAIYTHDVAITIHGHVPENFEGGERDLIATVMLQGCTPKLCLRPETHEIQITLNVTGSVPPQAVDVSTTSDHPEETRSVWELIRTNDFAILLEQGMGLTLLIVFLAGFLTSFTPCVWPVIPLVLAVVGTHPEHKWYRNVGLSLSLVIGMVLIYAALGIGAAALGKNLGFLFQQPIFLGIISLVFILFALSLFDVFHLQLPQSVHQFFHRLGGRGYFGAFLAGIGVGFIASPCVGPVLAALLTYVVLQKNYAFGFLALVVFGLGMGSLFIIIGSGFATITDHIKSGKWMVWIKRTLGVMLLVPAIFYLTTLAGFDPLGFFMKKGGAEQIDWLTSEPEALALAEQLQKPIMIDFYADWCPPCKKLDHRFFSRQEILELSRAFVMLRIDATVETEEVEAIVDKYSVIGWPTILFLGSDGTLYPDAIITAYDPDRIRAKMLEIVEMR